DLVQAARHRDSAAADDLERLTSCVREAADMARQGIRRGGIEVLSHGDIDQKNIVIGPDGPCLCDWDVASPWVPAHELVSTAISLGAASDFNISRRVVAAYEHATGRRVHLDGVDLAPSIM